MEYIAQMRADLAYVEAELANIHTRAGDRPLDEDEQRAFDEGTAYVTTQRDAINREVNRMAVAAAITNGAATSEPATAPEMVVKRTADPYNTLLNASSLSKIELRDEALRILEERSDSFAGDDHRQEAERRLRSQVNLKGGRAFARHMLAYGTDIYASAWSKIITNRSFLLTSEEQRAVQVGSNTGGGFMVPTHLDPTVILSNAGTDNPMRRVARVRQLNVGNVWNGVTSAGVTASELAESTAATDNSPTVLRESVTCVKQAAFARASFEAFDDIEGLAAEVVGLFADAKDRLEASRFATGNGTTQPAGLLTRLDADTTVEVNVTTQGTLGVVDLDNLIEGVPLRYRRNGHWFMNIKGINDIRALGGNDSNKLVDLAAATVPVFKGKPVVEYEELPYVVQSTTTNGIMIFGDPQHYQIVDRVGARVEFIENIVGQTNAFPRGERGWFVWWRVGGDVLANNAFRLLLDTT